MVKHIGTWNQAMVSIRLPFLQYANRKSFSHERIQIGSSLILGLLRKRRPVTWLIQLQRGALRGTVLRNLHQATNSATRSISGPWDASFTNLSQGDGLSITTTQFYNIVRKANLSRFSLTISQTSRRSLSYQTRSVACSKKIRSQDHQQKFCMRSFVVIAKVKCSTMSRDHISRIWAAQVQSIWQLSEKRRTSWIG